MPNVSARTCSFVLMYFQSRQYRCETALTISRCWPAHFITLICRRLNRPEPNLTQANLKQLQAYPWPGNIRELQNVIERAIIVSKGNRLQFNLPGSDVATGSVSKESADMKLKPLPFTETERLARDRVNILAALRLTNGKISGEDGAAELLGIKPTTLASRIKTLGIEKPARL